MKFSPNATNRADVERLIAELEQRKNPTQSAATTNPKPANGTQPSNTVSSSPPQPATSSRSYEGRGVGSPIVTVTPTSPAPESASPSPTSACRGPLWGGVALVAAGAAIGLGGGIGFGLASASNVSAIKNQQLQGVPFDPALDDSRRLDNTLMIVSAAVGAALAVTGGVLGIAGARQGRINEKSAMRVAPWIGQNGAGLSCAGAF